MKKIILPIIVMAALFAACTKDKAPVANNGNNNHTQGQYASLSAVMQNAMVKSQKKTIDASAGASFYASGGTRIVIPANAFMTENGANVTGNVEIEIREYLKRGDMLFSKVLPMSSGEPLVSGGELYFNATLNGQRLLLKNGNMFQANLPQKGTADPNMKLFVGETLENNAANGVNWVPAQKDSSHQNGFGWVVFNGDTLSMFCDSVGYCNADRFLSNPNYQNFTVTIAGVTIPAGTTVSATALYDNYNGLWPMLSRNGNIVTEGHVPDIPVHFVVMLVVDGHFYGGIQAATPANSGNYTVNVTEVDPAAFKAQVDAL